ncbi:uncharacterized protein LOC143017575 [Oratosquilla oratoria]|uniref:uncharacterized protein LOC143017575 n=1 Tax=Oratosquilla oratoria TaxID=337810 RepID=UPI003F7603E8
MSMLYAMLIYCLCFYIFGVMLFHRVALGFLNLVLPKFTRLTCAPGYNSSLADMESFDIAQFIKGPGLALLQNCEVLKDDWIALARFYKVQITEGEPEEFFEQFESLATTLSWPKPYWCVLVQTALMGISQTQEGKVHKGKDTWTLGKSNTDVSKIGCFYCKKFGHVSRGHSTAFHYSQDCVASLDKVLHPIRNTEDCVVRQSQGALERFHGTFKTMLAKYGHETGNEWDVGLPFLLYAIRCAEQSSLGFSPSELLFGRDIRGPMKLLHESWIDLEHADNLFEYVFKLKENLDVVHRFAQCNLKLSQEKMKENYDKDAVERNFEVGDEILLFLPVRKCPLQARYKGPFRVIGKRGDLNYVISTPDHRKTKRLVHVNLIKKYHRRDSGSAAKTVEKVYGTVNSLEVVEMQSEDDLDKIPVGNKLKNSDVLADLNSKLCHLSDSQQSDLSELLQEFVEIFGDVPRPTTEAVHHIELVEGAAPVREKPYRMSPHKAAILQKEVTFLLDNHLAEPSKSDWAAPCILVPKGNGEYRMCTDYRKLNALTKADNFPLPRIDDLIDSIGKAKIVTKLDLMSGYYQMPLSEEAKRVSSFITPSGLYQYKVTSFGLRNAPAKFSRLTSNVIAGLEGVCVYIDDMCVYSQTWEEHLNSLRSLFERLRKARLTVNLMKTEFAHAKVTFLGHEVGYGTVAPVHAKVEAIEALAAPANRKAVQRFLGIAGYYRRFCPNFSKLAKPLTDLVNPKVKFKWTLECQEAFDKIKSILTSKPVLHGPDFSKNFTINVDASDVAAEAVLMQEHDGILFPCPLVSLFLARYSILMFVT